MSELDNILGDLLQDNFCTGDNFGCDDTVFDVFNEPVDPADDMRFDALLADDDPILGKDLLKKKDGTILASVPSGDIIATTSWNQISINPAPTAVLPASPTQWNARAPPINPFVFGAALNPSHFGSNKYSRIVPSMVPVSSRHPNVCTQFRSMEAKEEEDKKEKKRLAVRKCREKKRKEMMALESRADSFSEEIRELRKQLKRARTSEGHPVENSAKNLDQVQALIAALKNQGTVQLEAVANKLVDIDCTATTPCSSIEAQGKEAVIEHFKSLDRAFSMSNISASSFTFGSSSESVIRCSWSMDVKQMAAAFGIHSCPSTSKTHTLKGGCRFTFDSGKITDVVLTWDHSQLILQLLGIPSLWK